MIEQITDTGVKELQGKLIEMMTAFHDYCVNNNIDYYMLGGTALGAYRHKGFIPWDDDIDLGIPREQYEKLLRDADRLPDGLELKTYHNTPNFPYNFAKLIDKNTTLIEEYYPKNVIGVFIDIFPLDGINENSLIEKMKEKQIYFWNCTLRSHYHTKPKDRLIKKIFQLFSGAMNPDYIHSKLDRLLKRDPFENSAVVANYLGAWWTREIMGKEVFDKPKLYSFESYQYYGPGNIKEYLRLLYGDYMKLPPEEERVFKHGVSYISFDEPYNEYKK